jgi:hypothetical protein
MSARVLVLAFTLKRIDVEFADGTVTLVHAPPAR